MFSNDFKKEQQKHLILFFDINGTVMASDSSRDKDLDGAILQLLAENITSIWDKEQKEPMTFRKYIEKYVCPSNNKDIMIKQTRMLHYKNFIEFLTINNHPLRETLKKQFNDIKNNLKEGDIFKSFIKLIDYLNKNQMKYTIIFRTFGHDLEKTIKEVSARTSLSFKPYAKFDSGELHLDEKQVLKTPQDILKSIKPFQHSGWRDHWEYWNAHGEVYEAGKPFPIDFTDENVVSIFFDDNACDKEIIGVKCVTQDISNQKNIQQALIEQGRIVPANTLKAILEENYFVNCVQFALKMPLAIPATKLNFN